MSFRVIDGDNMQMDASRSDTVEQAIERAKMIAAWRKDDEVHIMIQRSVPLWFAHLVRGTRFEFLGYTRYVERCNYCEFEGTAGEVNRHLFTAHERKS